MDTYGLSKCYDQVVLTLRTLIPMRVQSTAQYDAQHASFTAQLVTKKHRAQLAQNSTEVDLGLLLSIQIQLPKYDSKSKPLISQACPSPPRPQPSPYWGLSGSGVKFPRVTDLGSASSPQS